MACAVAAGAPSTLETPETQSRQSDAMSTFQAEQDRLRAELLMKRVRPAAGPLRALGPLAMPFAPNPFGLLPPPANSTGYNQPLQSPVVLQSENGVLNATLEVDYATHSLWSFKQNRAITTRLRSLNGGLTGPLLKLKPGDTLRVHLFNHLPPDTAMALAGGMHMDHGFNTTNLHTHGLHVSPSGNSDNVMLEVAPGADMQYAMAIPAGHPAGTFWYHSHVHGSTAIQVSSGMSGPLIIAGGLDEVPEIKAAQEKIFLFQQIPYSFDSGTQQYVVEDFWKSFGPNVWRTGVANNGWRTMINGQVVPVIEMQPGEVQRWRFIHGGVQETLSVQLEGHALHEIAKDGLALGYLASSETIQLEPGYRSDVLVKAEVADAGKVFFLIDGPTGPADSLLAASENPAVLAAVVVGGLPKEMALPSAGSLAPCAALAAIGDAEITGKQTLEFNVDTSTQPAGMQIDGKSYDPASEGRVLKLGGVEEWTITSRFANHPFHIHTNPFQVVSMKDESGHETVTMPFWKDTLLIKQGWVVKVRTRYSDFTGTFVTHCHILDHEDRGMMQKVTIVP